MILSDAPNPSRGNEKGTRKFGSLFVSLMWCKEFGCGNAEILHSASGITEGLLLKFFRLMKPEASRLQDHRSIKLAWYSRERAIICRISRS